MRRCLTALLFLPLLHPLVGHGQDSKSKPAGLTVPNVPGYERRVIEGFTLLIHQDVIKNDKDSKLERKPLDVLELELKGIVRVMNPKALNVLRQALIWVQWDDKTELSSGRKGTAVAVYYGGHQAAMLKKGEHPLKANAVTIITMKSLTAEHQPSRDTGRCVILHEIAHAVHHQLIGYDNAQVKAAFQQAMERKLYDKAMYAATNEKEFFAELSCAYLDKMTYYPRTREDLKKHDPVTFNLMEAVWGQPKVAKGKAEKLKSPFNLDVSVDTVRLGNTLLGSTVSAQDLQGRPALLLFWGIYANTSLSSLAKVTSWHKELADFGLVTVAAHSQKAKPEDVVASARARGVGVPIVASGAVANGMDFKELPHCFLFDHTGQCVYRGDPFQVETELRAAVGKAIVAGTNVGEFTKTLTGYAEALQKGKPPAPILQKIISHQKSPDEDTAEQAKLLVEQMTAVGRKRLEAAETLKDNDPVEAYFLVERLPAVFKSTPVATGADKLLVQLKKNKSVTLELKARPYLENVKKLGDHLTGKAGSFDPMLPKFQEANQVALNQMRTLLQQMTKEWPTTRATEEAKRIGEGFGVSSVAK
jgi:hypothetical protein